MKLSQIVFLFALVVAGCDAATDEGTHLAVYEVQVDSDGGPETFRVAVATSGQEAIADFALLYGRVGVLHGRVVRGDGGINSSYGWHLDPETVTFPDVAIDVCDGRPRSDVEADIDYWVDTIGVYCPWGARVVRRIE